jgi:hypothetical protein
MKQLYAPNGNLIVGTLETIKGRANVTGWNDDRSPEYAGSTEIFWDDQRTVQRDGNIICLDEDGEEYPFNECTLRDE